MEEIKTCKRCNKELPLNSFRISKGMKDGHRNECCECEKEERLIAFYNNKGLSIKSLNDYSVEQWWDLRLDNKITCIPKNFYNEKDMIKIIKYIYYNKINCKTKMEIVDNFNQKIWKKFKIKNIIDMLGGKESTINLCFDDLNICKEDLSIYSNGRLNVLLTNFIVNNDIKILDILNSKITIDKNIPNLSGYLCDNKISYINMWLNYFKINDIKHPETNKEIVRYDFRNQSKNIYIDENNRIDKIKYYCENKCSENILDFIKDSIKLRDWCKKYFNVAIIRENNLSGLSTYYKNYYNMLINAYPEIKNNHILFEWEWNTCVNSDKNFWIQAIREFFLFRMNYSLSECKEILPNIVNTQFFKEKEGKFNDCITRKKLFKNYKDWLILAFPECEWNYKDFKDIMSSDGHIMDSIEEKNVYEHIKNIDLFKFIFPNNRNRNGEYMYKVNSEKYNYFIPDFVIEYLFIGNKKIKLEKPIILEYYGMWNNGWHTNKIYLDYIEKTKFKEEFYKSNKDIYYIGIFPNDIKNNFEGLAKKLSLFYLEKFKEIS